MLGIFTANVQGRIQFILCNAIGSYIENILPVFSHSTLDLDTSEARNISNFKIPNYYWPQIIVRLQDRFLGRSLLFDMWARCIHIISKKVSNKHDWLLNISLGKVYNEDYVLQHSVLISIVYTMEIIPLVLVQDSKDAWVPWQRLSKAI